MAHRLVLLLAAGALAVPVIAVGQTFSFTESKDSNESPPTINADECKGLDPDGNTVTDNLTFFWTFASFNTNNQVRIDVSNKINCPVTDVNASTYTTPLVDLFTGNAATDQWPRANDTTTKIKAGDLVIKLVNAFGSAPGINCTTNATVYVCAVNTSATNVTANGSIPLNVQAPAAPTGVTVTPGESALNVSWTGPGGSPAATSFMARATAAQDPGNHDSSQVSGNSVRISNLQSNVTYTVVVFAFSQFNNRSPASASTTGTPVPVTDFWEAYKDAGGGEQGGCGAGSAGALSALLLPLALWRRRRS